MRARHLTMNGTPTPWRVYCCETFLSRARGRLGAAAQQQRQVWRLHPCSAVHTWFLKESIDVAFCDREGTIVRIIAPLRAQRCAWQRGAEAVWEFPVGSATRLPFGVGDRLTVCD